jgi:hypothetical protein
MMLLSFVTLAHDRFQDCFKLDSIVESSNQVHYRSFVFNQNPMICCRTYLNNHYPGILSWLRQTSPSRQSFSFALVVTIRHRSLPVNQSRQRPPEPRVPRRHPMRLPRQSVSPRHPINLSKRPPALPQMPSSHEVLCQPFHAPPPKATEAIPASARTSPPKP